MRVKPANLVPFDAEKKAATRLPAGLPPCSSARTAEPSTQTSNVNLQNLVLLKHSPIPAVCGAVGEAKHRRGDHASGQALIGVEILFPPDAKLAHPRVWMERTCIYQFHEDPRTAPANMSGIDVNYLARRSSELLIEALENDLFPSKDVETVFGICMEHPLGQLVRDAWDRLYRHHLVSVDSITSAQLRGTLPYFFEQKVVELEQVAPNDSLPEQLRAAAGTGFCLIEWDIDLLVKIARVAINA